MTRKVYKSAMGKEVDLGALLLQNESVRAVGNMNVNARGDRLDGSNRVIDEKSRQVQRQYRRTTNVTNTPVQTSSRAAQKTESTVSEEIEEIFNETADTVEVNESPVVEPAPQQVEVIPPTGPGGLAAAIARSRLIKQEKEKTLRERAREQAIKKI